MHFSKCAELVCIGILEKISLLAAWAFVFGNAINDTSFSEHVGWCSLADDTRGEILVITMRIDVHKDN